MKYWSCRLTQVGPKLERPLSSPQTPPVPQWRWASNWIIKCKLPHVICLVMWGPEAFSQRADATQRFSCENLHVGHGFLRGRTRQMAQSEVFHLSPPRCGELTDSERATVSTFAADTERYVGEIGTTTGNSCPHALGRRGQDRYSFYEWEAPDESLH